MMRRKWLLVALALAGCGAAYLGWKALRPRPLPEGFASSNGRIEAVEIDVAAKTAGRLKEVLVNEGDFVTAGQVLARMDTEVLAAQLREAEADSRKAKSAVDTAKSTVVQRESEKAAGLSVVAQREAEFDGAKRTRTRAEAMSAQGVGSAEVLDGARVQFFSSEAAVKAARANVAAADAAIATARSQVIQAEATVDAAKSRIERLQADIDDSTLRAPRDGRVQYRVAQPGEVLAAGGKVLNMVDLGDVYMTFFLPTADAGRARMGTEVHIVLDAAPQFVIPARVSYVADVAQFTPKTVETAQERQKLMFRIKARIDPDLLKKHINRVKTGLPGVAYAQLDPGAEWPADIRVRLPE
ncbi:glycoside hydrolase family 43 [Gemmata obscuriglobus]|uniref:Glycoside hydrolase family 43 n=2 Tax=Gemmata obscuriglobus TaxID=114 RepID=A0A2Z3HH66_9BACT|nr:glycoside hydrolase family 43 [Gemmata obscuriglobus]